MMDKAKAYDEALKRARKMLDKILNNELIGFPDQIREIFPQLKESNDERIRKAIIGLIEELQRSDKYFAGVELTDMIAYLEKQKECVIDNTSEDEKMLQTIIQGFKNWKANGMERFNGTKIDDILVYLEKRKYNRMQPVYDNQESFESALDKAWKAYNDCGSRIVDSCEDDYIESAYAKGFRKGYLFGLEKLWSNEWSEEDEKDMAHIIRILDDCYVYGTHDLSKTDHENLVNKLKSLRPSWKPSEEQMEALNKAIPVCMGVVGRDAVAPLESLCEQLEKLM